MRFNYFLKSLVLVALMAWVVNAKAAQFTVADGATDTELAAALNSAADGDVILINGWVTINQEVEITKNVTLKGVGDAAGFDGAGLSRLFWLHPDPVDGVKLVFDNLMFLDGHNIGTDNGVNSGGAAKIDGGCVVDFISCYFEGNEAGRGGAFYIAGAATDPQPTTVTFNHCEATANRAYGLSGEESRAGYLFADGNTNVTHEFCTITRNQSIGGRGGAFCLAGGTHRFYYTIIESNKAGNWMADPANAGQYIKLDADGNPVTGDNGPYEGGAFFIMGSDASSIAAVTFESSSVVDNQAWSHAPAIFNGNNSNITFINSTVAKNWVVGDGRAPIWAQSGTCTFTFVNSLFVENQGVNSGNGAGFDGNDNANVTLNIFNSVFERNICTNSEGAVDIRAIPNIASQIVVKNSIIGFIQGDDSRLTAQDNANIPTKSNTRLYKVAVGDMSQPDYASPDFLSSGILYGEMLQRTLPFGMSYYLLGAGSTVTKLGDPALLVQQDIDTDMFGQTRVPAADGSISAAPTLASTEEEYNDLCFVDPSDPSCGNGTIRPQIVKEGINVISSSNGTLGIDFGSLSGIAKGSLISITGQEVEKVFDTAVVSKGYYNINVAPGMYILKVEIGGKAYAQKLVVTK